MKRKIATYLDNVFAARQLPGIAWGAFLPHLIACVKADGGTWNELHQYFEFPPILAGGSWEIVHINEIRKHLRWL